MRERERDRERVRERERGTQREGIRRAHQEFISIEQSK